MGSELYDRLKHLKHNRSTRAPGAPGTGAPDRAGPDPGAPGTSAPDRAGPLADSAGGRWQEPAEGVWLRRTEVASESAAYVRSILKTRSSSVVPADFEADKLVFFDAETTGLSSGAGTIAFLVGFARLTGEGVSTAQLFMSDYPAEPAFLEVLTSLIHEEDLLISYNGKGFDSQVLTTRFLLNGMRLPIGAQLDLLYMARRLWKTRLPDCTLSTIERSVLDITRERDLPSGEVPERYFEYLRSGNAALLEDVFAHHLQDIESLVSLLARVERSFEDPAHVTNVDTYQLGRMLLSQGREEGLDVLHRVVRESESARQSVRAAHELGKYYRRRGSFDTPAGVWREVLERYSSITAGIEVAKHLEHKRKDLSEAERLVTRLLSWPHSAAFRGELTRRLERIRRRQGRRE